MKSSNKSGGHVLKLVVASLFAALICAATMLVQIRLPSGGYINMGDCFVLLSAWMLSPIYGSLAAGIGSMLSDVIFGYTMYAPGTFVIKLLAALTASLIYNKISGKSKLPALVIRIFSGIFGELVMILGYFAYEGLILGLGTAAAVNMLWNAIQAVFGIISAVILIEIILKNKTLNKYHNMLK